MFKTPATHSSGHKSLRAASQQSVSMSDYETIAEATALYPVYNDENHWWFTLKTDEQASAAQDIISQLLSERGKSWRPTAIERSSQFANSERPVRFKLSGENLQALRKWYLEKCGFLSEGHFFIKALRADSGIFLKDYLSSHLQIKGKYIPKPLRGLKQRYIATLDGVVSRREKKPMYSPEEKAEFSKKAV